MLTANEFHRMHRLLLAACEQLKTAGVPFSPELIDWWTQAQLEEAKLGLCGERWEALVDGIEKEREIALGEARTAVFASLDRFSRLLRATGLTS